MHTLILSPFLLIISHKLSQNAFDPLSTLFVIYVLIALKFSIWFIECLQGYASLCSSTLQVYLFNNMYIALTIIKHV
jgi:hypothetical protein